MKILDLIFIFTKLPTPVQAGEEVTFDYQFIHFGAKGQKCLCGAPSCTGVIGRQAGVEEYRKKAGVKDVNIDYAKQIMSEFLFAICFSWHTIGLIICKRGQL